MNHALAFLLVSTVEVDVGWQPTRDRGFEYILQIEPEVLESLRDGQEIISDIPPFLRGVRSYRIRVGTEPLPQEGVPPEIEPAESDTPAPGPADNGNEPTPATPGNADDDGTGFNESIAPEPAPEDDMPDARSGASNDGPTLLSEDTDEEED